MKAHKHKWEAVKRGFPQRVCRCGLLRATSIVAGENSITLSPSGVGDVIRWSATKAAVAAGDIGMNTTTGRLSMFVSGAAQDVPVSKEVIGGHLFRGWGIQQNAGLTTLSQYGYSTAPTTTGTASVVDVASVGQFIQYESAASTNADAGWSSAPINVTQLNFIPLSEHIIRTGSDITNVRYFIGLASTDPMGASVGNGHYALFRYDTGADGTAFWRCATDNNTGTPTVTTTTTAIAADTSYRLRVATITTTDIRFFINGALVATHTTTTPNPGQNLAPWSEVRTLENVAKSIQLSKVFVSQNAASS